MNNFSGYMCLCVCVCVCVYVYVYGVYARARIKALMFNKDYGLLILSSNIFLKRYTVLDMTYFGGEVKLSLISIAGLYYYLLTNIIYRKV